MDEVLWRSDCYVLTRRALSAGLTSARLSNANFAEKRVNPSRIEYNPQQYFFTTAQVNRRTQWPKQQVKQQPKERATARL
jgi:hypothetical protein